MRGKIITGITPQQKMVAVNNKFGNTNIKSQQGTSRVLYDSLPLDGRTEFRFFENANTRPFPLTNLTADGNRLQVGETFTIEKITLFAINYDSAKRNQVTAQTYLDMGIGGQQLQILLGELDFFIANNQVIKSLPSSVFNPTSNPNAQNNNDVAFETATDIVIPPLLEFICVLKTPTLTGVTPAITDNHLRLQIEGTAGILAPQTTF